MDVITGEEGGCVTVRAVVTRQRNPRKETSASPCQEHMAIDVCPGPIRPIRKSPPTSPALSPTSEPLSPKPTGFPMVSVLAAAASGMGGGGRGGLLTPLRRGAMGGGGVFVVTETAGESVEINSSDSDDCTALGTLEFDLRYERASSQLHCTILRAKVTSQIPFTHFLSPYSRLSLREGTCRANKLKTKIVRNTLNPVWNEMLTYVGITEEDMHRKTLRLSVCDEDKLTHNEFIGESRVPLKRVKPDQTKHFHTCLEHPPPLPSPTTMGTTLRGISCYLRENFRTVENEQLHSLEERGRVLLLPAFLSPLDEGEEEEGGRRRKGLCVGVQRCAHLPAHGRTAFSDPNVKTYLKPDTQKKSKHKTAVIKKTLNPEFNEEFFYEISMSELSNKTLEVTVWDYDLGRSNDFIGGVCLSCHSQGDPLRHWMDCLKNKGQRVERWHILTNELPRSVSHE
nr:double C2-like domain-containing protein alpha [Salvelinus alpinus]